MIYTIYYPAFLDHNIYSNLKEYLYENNLVDAVGIKLVERGDKSDNFDIWVEFDLNCEKETLTLIKLLYPMTVMYIEN